MRHLIEDDDYIHPDWWNRHTDFKFSFERKSTVDGIANGLAGVYLVFENPPIIEIYLSNIAYTQLAFVPSFYELFKPSYIDEIENNMIRMVEESIEHEYLHHIIGKTECPMNKQHFFIDKMDCGKHG